MGLEKGYASFKCNQCIFEHMFAANADAHWITDIQHKVINTMLL